MKQNRFTLIEFVVVIAILLVVASMLQPALKRTLWGAKHSVCLNNLKQTYQAFALYYDNEAILKPWEVANGTFDGPHEAAQNSNNGNPGNPAKVLVNEEYGLTPANLFCPLVENLNANAHFDKNASNNNKKNGHASFWSSYAYLYKKNRKGILMADVQEAVWQSFETAYKIPYDQPFRNHYNILNQDGTVVFLTDVDQEFLAYFPDDMVGK